MSITGIELKQWRESRGLSQAQFAELLPVSLRTLQGWETGKGSPAGYIARALNDLDNGLGDSKYTVKDSQSEVPSAQSQVSGCEHEPELAELRAENEFLHGEIRSLQKRIDDSANSYAKSPRGVPITAAVIDKALHRSPGKFRLPR